MQQQNTKVGLKSPLLMNVDNGITVSPNKEQVNYPPTSHMNLITLTCMY